MLLQNCASDAAASFDHAEPSFLQTLACTLSAAGQYLSSMERITATIMRDGIVFLERVEVMHLFDGSYHFDAPRAMFEDGEELTVFPVGGTSFHLIIRKQLDTSDPVTMRLTCS